MKINVVDKLRVKRKKNIWLSEKMKWNEYVKEQREKLNKKRKREKLDPLSYRECLKVCSETWPAEKERLAKKQKRVDKKKLKADAH